MRIRLALVVVAALHLQCVQERPGRPERNRASEAALSVATSPMADDRQQPIVVTLLDGRVLAGGDFFARCEIYDPTAGAWSATGSMATNRSQHALVVLPDGRVLAAGGAGGPGPSLVAVATAEIFDPATGTWTGTSSLGVARQRSPPAVVLPDGRVLVAGGYAQGGYAPLESAEVYDPATGTWTATGPMTAGVTRLVPLADGRVVGLAAGRRVQLFDPQTGGWTDGGPVPAGQSVQIVARLPDGRVLASGGGDPGTEFGRTSILDPGTLQWSSAGSMSQGRFDTAVAVRPDGSVLALGGLDGTGTPLATVERFDPATGTWTAAAPLLEARFTPGVAALAEGKLLVVGGRSRVSGAWVVVESVEIYDDCQPTTCGAAGATCGPVASGCGGVLDCGGCGPGQACTANQCSCAPTSCVAAGAQCGDVDDGCGGTLACGICAPGSSCVSNHCVCAARTCAAAGVQCGAIADGCGGALDCGACADGFLCRSGTCSEATPPTVVITTPEPGIVGGIVTIAVSASDDVAVTRVEVYASATRIADLLGPGPHVVTWDTTYFSYGTWPLEARAYDAAGNVGRSPPVAVTIVNPNAAYDATLRAPRCPVTANCRSGSLLLGRGPVGPEPSAPNTILGSCQDGTSGTFHADESLDGLRIRTLDGSVLAPGKTVEVEAEVWAYSTGDYLEVFSAPNASQPAWTRVAIVRALGSGFNRLKATFVLPTGSLQAIRGRFSWGAPGSTAYPCLSGFYADHDDLVFGVQPAPDRAPPTASITAPASGATLTGPVSVAASVGDDVGVSRAELWLDATTRLATWFGSPYSTTWDPRTVAPGTHQLTVRAFDAAGNQGVSPPVAVNVVRDTTPPAVAFASPVDGAVISGAPTMRVTSSDDVGVKVVDYYLDGTWIGNSYVAPDYSFYLPTRSFPNGPHAVEARASDAAGNVGVARVLLTFANDVTPPVVSILLPAASAIVSGVVGIDAAASDDVGVIRVEILVDGAIVATKTAAPYGASWDSTSQANGTHSITVKAYDAAGNVGSSPARPVTVANGPSTPGLAAYDPGLRAPRCALASPACDTADLVRGRAGLGPEQNAPNTINGSCADGTAGTYHADESLDRLRISTLDGTPLEPGKTVRVEATVWVWGAASDRLDLYYATNGSSPTWTLLRTLAPTANGQQTLSTTFTLGAGPVQAIRGVFRYGGAPGTCSSGSYDDRDDLVFAAP